MSKFFVPHPLMACLVGVEKHLGSTKEWKPTNAGQKKFIYDIYTERGDLRFFRDWELKTYADKSAAKLNEILKKKEFDIYLSDLGPDGVGAVSILKVVFDWIKKGIKCSMEFSGKNYQAMKFEDGFTVYSSPKHRFPIVKMEAMGGYEIFITLSGEGRSVPSDGFSLYDTINGIMKNISIDEEATYENKFLKVPYLKIDTELDVGWMLGISNEGLDKRPVVLEQVKEQLKLVVDEKGMKIDAAAAVGTRSMGITINKPFYMLVKKKGVWYGIVYSLIDTDALVEEQR
ncbi:MAG: hypothetical protein PHG66_05240 [Candidatus Colwellbacteria bacterium]|nr:hypothetical protein [Candidatus Colwellbacteria bacterium]